MANADAEHKAGSRCVDALSTLAHSRNLVDVSHVILVPPALTATRCSPSPWVPGLARSQTGSTGAIARHVLDWAAHARV